MDSSAKSNLNVKILLRKTLPSASRARKVVRLFSSAAKDIVVKSEITIAAETRIALCANCHMICLRLILVILVMAIFGEAPCQKQDILKRYRTAAAAAAIVVAQCTHCPDILTSPRAIIATSLKTKHILPISSYIIEPKSSLFG
jgi:RNase P subunit RPR2